MEYLKPALLTFRATTSGLLALDGPADAVHPHVECIPLFPLSRPEAFIAVNGFPEGERSVEIGIIRDLKQFLPAQQELVRKDLALRYFAPQIIDIQSIETKFDIDEWVVITDRGKKVFHVINARENLSMRGEGRVMVTDLEKCRYLVPDYRLLPAKARDLLEQQLL
jgi:hypothetical protein